MNHSSLSSMIHHGDNSNHQHNSNYNKCKGTCLNLRLDGYDVSNLALQTSHHQRPRSFSLTGSSCTTSSTRTSTRYSSMAFPTSLNQRPHQLELERSRRERRRPLYPASSQLLALIEGGTSSVVAPLRRPQQEEDLQVPEQVQKIQLQGSVKSSSCPSSPSPAQTLQAACFAQRAAKEQAKSAAKMMMRAQHKAASGTGGTGSDHQEGTGMYQHLLDLHASLAVTRRRAAAETAKTVETAKSLDQTKKTTLASPRPAPTSTTPSGITAAPRAPPAAPALYHESPRPAPPSAAPQASPRPSRVRFASPPPPPRAPSRPPAPAVTVPPPRSFTSTKQSQTFQSPAPPSPPPQPTSTRTSSTSSPPHPTPTPTPTCSNPVIQVGPDKFAPYYGAAYTLHAVDNNQHQITCCMSCHFELACLPGIEYVICPACQILSKVEYNNENPCVAPHGAGIGLRRTATTTVPMTKKKHQQHHQPQQTRRHTEPIYLRNQSMR